MKRNLNIFPVKVRVLSHYIPRMILSHKNWDYKNHFQAELVDYLQASQVNKAKNKNRPRTLDGI